MERLESIVVHLEEALLLCTDESAHKQRLGLILIDGVVETLMHRRVKSAMWDERFAAGLLAQIDEGLAAGYEATTEILELRATLLPQTLSKTRKRKVDRNFDDKATYLSETGALPAHFPRALRRLHQYRNHAQHREHVRKPSLVTAVRIYCYLGLEMMRLLGPRLIGYGSSGEPSLVLQKHLGEHVDYLDFAVQTKIADSLAAQFGLESLELTSEILAAHLSARLDQVEEDLSWAALETAHWWGLPDWDSEAILHLIQVDDWSSIETANEARRVRVEVGQSDFDTWRGEIEALAAIDDPVLAFTHFADLEEAIEKVEDPLEEMNAVIDQTVEGAIDLARGK